MIIVFGKEFECLPDIGLSEATVNLTMLKTIGNLNNTSRSFRQYNIGLTCFSTI